MTTRILYGEESRLLPWAAKRVGVGRFRLDATCIGLERDGEIIAVVVFDTFSDADCIVHVASDGGRMWLSRGFLACVFAYPFVQLGFLSVSSVIDARNEESIRFNEKIGFTRCGYRRLGMPGGGDYVITEMMKSGCRWIQKDLTTEGAHHEN